MIACISVGFYRFQKHLTCVFMFYILLIIILQDEASNVKNEQTKAKRAESFVQGHIAE